MKGLPHSPRSTKLMPHHQIEFCGGARGVIVIVSGGARGVIVIVIGNEHGDTSSNPGRDWLHFT